MMLESPRDFGLDRGMAEESETEELRVQTSYRVKRRQIAISDTLPIQGQESPDLSDNMIAVPLQSVLTRKLKIGINRLNTTTNGNLTQRKPAHVSPFSLIKPI